MQVIFSSTNCQISPDESKVTPKIGAKDDAISFSTLLDLPLIEISHALGGDLEADK
jgi:hypothetical protein